MKITAIVLPLLLAMGVCSLEAMHERSCSGLQDVLRSAKSSEKLIVHHFAFDDENVKKESFVSSFFAKPDKVLDRDMINCSCQLLEEMRSDDRFYIQFKDLVVSALGIWEMEECKWIKFPDRCFLDDIVGGETVSDITYCHNNRSIFVYNIGEDSVFTDELNIKRILCLLKNNASVIVNIAKNKWNKTFEKAFSGQQVEFFGEKPEASKYFMGLRIFGGFSLAAIVGVLLYYKLIFTKNG